MTDTTSGAAVRPSSAAGQPTVTAVWALFCGIGFLMAGNGLQGALLGVRADAEGFDLVVTGLIMTAYFAGFFVGASFAVRVVGQVGHIRVFAALASTASSAVLIHAISIEPITWVAMRAATGFCMAGLYVVAESWLNDYATNETRGRMLATYMVVTMGGLAAGQALLNIGDTGGFTLFVVASVLVSFSLVPVSLSTVDSPPLRYSEPMSIRQLLAVVPTGVVVSVLVGFSNGTLIGMAAVYAAAIGASAAEVSLFILAPTVGAVAFQWPIGAISDRVSRRAVIAAVAAGATLVASLLALTDDITWYVLVLMFLLGGATFPLYSLGIAYANDWLPAERMPSASGALVKASGVGAIAGPLVTALAMAWVDPDMFYVSIGVVSAAIVAFVISRMLVRDPLPVDEQADFVPFPARGSALAGSLFKPRRR